MFNPQTGSPSTVFPQQQAAFNPFTQGGALGTSPFQQPFGVQPQQTGFVIPQQTSFLGHSPHNPFGQHLQPQLTAMPFMQPQPTAAPLVPQMTAINPFRQNTLNGTNGIQPQAAGFDSSPFGPSPFGPSPTGASSFGPSPTSTSPFGPSPVNQGTSPFQNLSQAPGQQPPFGATGPFNFNQQSNTSSPFTLPQQLQHQQSQPPPQSQNPVNTMSVPPRPASAPLKNSSPEPIKPLVAQQTGSRNPFGVPTSPPPPVPKVPTLMELAMNKQHELRQIQQQQQQNGQPGQIYSNPSDPGAGSAMSNIASDFATLGFRNNNPSTNTLSPQMTSTTNSSLSTDTLFSSVSTQPTGITTSTAPSIPVQPTGGLNSHTTGLGTFTGLKTFKPSSSFGASLLESLPPIPGSGPATPSTTSENQGQLGSPPSNSAVSSPGPATNTSTALGGFGISGLNLGLANKTQPNGLGSTLGGSGLSTQPTGLGALNAQQPLTTGLGGGLGTGPGTGGFGTGLGSILSTGAGTGTGGVGVGLSAQTTDAQGAANPFRLTPGFGGIGSGSSGGLGTNPGLGLGGFTGGLGGLGGTPFGQNPNAQLQPQQQRQGSLI